jgi:hypothetical protein
MPSFCLGLAFVVAASSTVRREKEWNEKGLNKFG